MIFDDKDLHGWIKFSKNKIKWETEIYKAQKNGFTDNGYPELQYAANAVTEIINIIQLAIKLSNLKPSFKTQWSILQTFKNRKIITYSINFSK